MSILNTWYKTSRWNDFWGGINLRNSSDSIDDKQWTQWINFVSEGNKLVTIPGYQEYITPWSGVSTSQAIAAYSTSILSIHNRNLYIYDTVAGTTFTRTNAVISTTDKYSIVTTKSFTSWKISIVLININLATTEDIVAYEFDWALFTAQTFISLTNKNFKCGAFHEGKLLLGWNPLYPSNLYYSKTGSVLGAAATNIYDFSWYNSNFQNIGDGEPVVAILSNISELYVFKTNSVHKNIGTFDNGTAYLFQFKQEASTWALNTKCVLPVEKDILYFDWINLRRISYEANMQALSDNSISKDIESIISWLPSSQSSNATMYYVYPFVKLFLRDKFSVNNSVGIIYNIVDKSFSIQTWLDVVQWIGGFINSKRVAYVVTPQTSTIYEDNQWIAYNAGNINASYKSKRYVLWDGVDYKRISQLELYGKVTQWLEVFIDVYVNGLLIDTRSILITEILLPTAGSSMVGNTLFGAAAEDALSPLNDYVVRYEYFNDGRDFQFWIRSNWQGRFELHGLNLIYKSIKAYDIHS